MLWLVWSSIQATKIFYISANKVFHFLFLLFWLHHTTCGILVSWPGIEHGLSAVKAWSLNCWISREFPASLSYSCVHWNSTFNFLQEIFLCTHNFANWCKRPSFQPVLTLDMFFSPGLIMSSFWYKMRDLWLPFTWNISVLLETLTDLILILCLGGQGKGGKTEWLAGGVIRIHLY